MGTGTMPALCATYVDKRYCSTDSNSDENEWVRSCR